METLEIKNIKQVTPIQYGDYLKVDDLLKLQKLRSEEYGVIAHDELLFITVHQTYELWFKQILHEVGIIQKLFSADFVFEEDMGNIVSRLDRVVEILRLLVDQVSVLETMTPLDFLDFRNLLHPASGFQSVQWRMIENSLGLLPSQRLKYNSNQYTDYLNKKEQSAVQSTEPGAAKSLFDQVDHWLARAPFLTDQNFAFMKEYRSAIIKSFAAEKETVARFAKSPEEKERNEKQIEATLVRFEAVFSAERFESLRKEGHFRLSHRAFQAALVILLYRDLPLLTLPFQLITKLQDIDELMTAWRYRHALMVHRMLGSKIGTGGSSGHEYLKAATESHRIFSDFFNLATFLMPRSQLPQLPLEFRKNLCFENWKS